MKTGEMHWMCSSTSLLLVAMLGVVACGGTSGGSATRPSDAGTPPGTTPGGNDAGQQPVVMVLAEGQPLATAIVVDDTRVYWSRLSESDMYSGIYSVARNGGPVEKVATVYAPELRLDATHFYFPFNDSVRRVPKGGGTPEVLATGRTQARALALDADHVYWGHLRSDTDFPLMRAHKTGAEPRELAHAPGPLQAIAVEGDAVYWVHDGTGTCYSGVSGQNGGALMKTSLFSGETMALLRGLCGTAAMALDGTHVYLLTATQLLRVPKGGGTHEVLEDSVLGPTSLVLDDTYVYWTYEWKQQRLSELMRRPKAGGLAETLYDRGTPGRLTRDGRTLFWVGQGSTSVMKLDF